MNLELKKSKSESCLSHFLLCFGGVLHKKGAFSILIEKLSKSEGTFIGHKDVSGVWEECLVENSNKMLQVSNLTELFIGGYGEI